MRSAKFSDKLEILEAWIMALTLCALALAIGNVFVTASYHDLENRIAHEVGRLQGGDTINARIRNPQTTEATCWNSMLPQ